MPARFFPLLLALLLPLAACDSATEDVPRIEDTTFAPELEVDLAAMTLTPSGLYWRDIRVGSGLGVSPGQVVATYYTGWLPDGEEFDSRQPDALPFEFVLGTGSVIRGWDQGLLGMRVGGTRQLVVPPHLAYGTRPPPGLPSNAILVFRVTIEGVR